ncbi:FprA family A-type flavoprotein [Clostridium sp. SM-530-WT-3G]|uniref:FprA family A-type flavoprotein n=1 Tax=Clostridium sp. SM-530-WT-3G TaxID=2725303 RepID=UPI00145CC8D0|nr:FprA family A-type flavoprotein [Clostridium sp. SM-530-WT-3G]NME81693.1 FprA family A-type flavoprotein [Clostridium sp. SM-530-WT-3G]
MNNNCITDSIKYIGVNDKTLDLFESQYKIPNGVSYNSYVILDEKIAVMDTVDKRALNEWLDNLDTVLEGRQPDYLVISHLEPDHAANIQILAEKYSDMKLVGNKKIFDMLPQFFDFNIEDRKVIVSEGDELNLGKHTLQFFMAPMVHWPEVMVEYEKTEKILFSADGFGKFGSLDVEEDWTDEARRYYINIVGKYGAAVQTLLKKASTLDIKTICPLHGPVLKENLGYYIDKYVKWSSYTPEEEGTVVAYASIHGNTAEAAKKMAEILKNKGAKNVVLYDLSRADMSQVIADCYRYDKLVVACATYDGGLFPCMEDFLNHLKHKNFQNRKVGIIENSSWTPTAGKCMKDMFNQMKDIKICDTMVSIKSVAKAKDIETMNTLADELLK